jgi:hypothetical protein
LIGLCPGRGQSRLKDDLSVGRVDGAGIHQPRPGQDHRAIGVGLELCAGLNDHIAGRSGRILRKPDELVRIGRRDPVIEEDGVPLRQRQAALADIEAGGQECLNVDLTSAAEDDAIAVDDIDLAVGADPSKDL